MALWTLEELKGYLRVEYGEDDTLIEQLETTAEEMCVDMLRADSIDDVEENSKLKNAVLFATAVLYQDREATDYGKLQNNLHAMLLANRKAAF